ncbi:hypothetical protein MJO29_015734, partial [Puccinia striiformis f. sp. tritici]
PRDRRESKDAIGAYRSSKLQLGSSPFPCGSIILHPHRLQTTIITRTNIKKKTSTSSSSSKNPPQITMYCRISLAVFLILQAVANAAPSSSGEVGAKVPHVKRAGYYPSQESPADSSDPLLFSCTEIDAMSRHENDGSTSWRRCSLARSPPESPTLLLHFPQRHVACTPHVCYLSIPQDKHTFCNLYNLASIVLTTKHLSKKKPSWKGVN